MAFFLLCLLRFSNLRYEVEAGAGAEAALWDPLFSYLLLSMLFCIYMNIRYICALLALLVYYYLKCAGVRGLRDG